MTDRSRRIVRGGRYGYTLFVRVARQERDDFERTALLNGHVAVIDGKVVEPGRP